MDNKTQEKESGIQRTLFAGLLEHRRQGFKGIPELLQENKGKKTWKENQGRFSKIQIIYILADIPAIWIQTRKEEGFHFKNRKNKFRQPQGHGGKDKNNGDKTDKVAGMVYHVLGRKWGNTTVLEQ